MLVDLTHWISSLNKWEILWLLLGLLILDGPRYTFVRIVFGIRDVVGYLWSGRPVWSEYNDYDYCPSACVILAGHNEGATIGQTIESLTNSYPRLEIIVVDDGSNDAMANMADRYADLAGVRILHRPSRGGKSSALNFALPFTQADVIISVDADSHLNANGLWEIVQPFRDPSVGAVSATVHVRNAFTNLTTWMQAYEYVQCIFMGRMLADRMGILSITSGAFAAIRRTALERVMGWDVGPGEDLDLTMRIRKAGYQIVSAPYAECFTDVPTTWRSLLKQRRRWEEAAVIRFHCRKHVDLADPLSARFRWADFVMLAEAWLFNVACPLVALTYTAILLWQSPVHLGYLILTYYFCSVALEVVQATSVFLYTLHVRRDLLLSLVVPLMPIYHFCFLMARVASNAREFLWKTSYEDDFVPRHVRESTWHW